LGDGLTLTRLTSNLGARVEGIDLHGDVSREVIEQLREALWTHHVLVFAEQDIGLEEQSRLMNAFGALEPLPPFKLLGEPNAALAVQTRGGGPLDDDGQATRRVTFDPRASPGAAARVPSEFQAWHADSTFAPQIVHAASLRPEVIPPVGGDTCFAGLCAAYDALSPLMQQWCENLRAVHDVPSFYRDAIQIWQYGEEAEERFDAAYPPREHPVVIEHPHSRRKALFVNPVYTVRISGVSDKESTHILRFLYDHVATPDFVYRHHWSPGDIVVWDELVVLHLAPVDHEPHARKLVRVTAGLVTPTAPRPVQVPA
jgi:taurine dioxygenase